MFFLPPSSAYEEKAQKCGVKRKKVFSLDWPVSCTHVGSKVRETHCTGLADHDTATWAWTQAHLANIFKGVIWKAKNIYNEGFNMEISEVEGIMFAI